ncbi:VCBS repeat-containing protein [Myxococcus sp. K15C18031901]|uniref:FG-GAP repeat domain-containing protein n=1 Tax=Myxococcus dinghuensis TaxID=2906761 RepID=UPI0020A6F009|nr:VCBS repeat-containing protein [Myxococcus dinghuensis]MCP3099882.1 VCBS repeat-containing protein [Myxococcus dinghuensis]
MSRALLLTSLLAALAAGAASNPTSVPDKASAVTRLTWALADDLRALPVEAPVALHLSGGSAELRRAVGSLLAARLAVMNLAPTVLDAPSPEAAEALARAQGARTLARLTLDVETGMLRARGDVLGTWVNFWSGRTPTRPARPAGALSEAVDADPEVLALAAVGGPPQPPTPQPGVRGMRFLGATFARLDTPVAALAAGDLDGDGKDEVAALTEHEVSVFAADGRLLARRALDGIAPASVTTREPFGALAVLTGPPRLAAWSTRHAHGELLVLDVARAVLRPVGTLDAAPVGPLERGAFVPGQTAFQPEVRMADGKPLTVVAPFTTASLAPPRMLFVHPDGVASLFSRPGTAFTRLSGLGAGSALGDLDGDGVPELLTTSPLLQPSPDVLRVHALQDADPTTHEPLWQGALPAGRALGVVTADLFGDGRREVIVALWKPDGTSELFLLRQGAP